MKLIAMSKASDGRKSFTYSLDNPEDFTKIYRVTRTAWRVTCFEQRVTIFPTGPRWHTAPRAGDQFQNW